MLFQILAALQSLHPFRGNYPTTLSQTSLLPELPLSALAPGGAASWAPAMAGESVWPEEALVFPNPSVRVTRRRILVSDCAPARRPRPPRVQCCGKERAQRWADIRIPSRPWLLRMALKKMTGEVGRKNNEEEENMPSWSQKHISGNSIFHAGKGHIFNLIFTWSWTAGSLWNCFILQPCFCQIINKAETKTLHSWITSKYFIIFSKVFWWICVWVFFKMNAWFVS